LLGCRLSPERGMGGRAAPFVVDAPGVAQADALQRAILILTLKPHTVLPTLDLLCVLIAYMDLTGDGISVGSGAGAPPGDAAGVAAAAAGPADDRPA